MSINIKQADGLKRLTQTVEFYKQTTDSSLPEIFGGDYNDLINKPISDGVVNAESIETNADTFYVQDANGNTIATIDSSGVHSIDFIAGSQSVKTHMQSAENQFNDINADIAEHTGNNNIHITADEREQWNHPLDDDGDTLYIQDASGHTIAIFNADGLTTTKVRIYTYTENGEIKGDIDVAEKIGSIDTSINAILSKNNNQDATIEELKTAAEKLDYIEATATDDMFKIVDQNDQPIAQFDSNGLTVTDVKIAAPDEAKDPNNSETDVDSYQVASTLKTIIDKVHVAESNISSITEDLNEDINNLATHIQDIADDSSNTQPHVSKDDRTTWNTVTSKADQSALNDTNQNLATEITNRQNADKTLQDNINNEAEIRANADQAINNRTEGIEASADGKLSIADESGAYFVAQFDDEGLTVTDVQARNTISARNIAATENIIAGGDISAKNITATESITSAKIIANTQIETPEVMLNEVSLKDTLENIKLQITNIESAALKREIVTELPTSDIKDNTIYLVKKDDDDDKHNYLEYLYINDKWETIGETTATWDGYATNDELTAAIDTHNEATDAHNDIRMSITGLQKKDEDLSSSIQATNDRTEGIEANNSDDVFRIVDSNNNPTLQIDNGQTTIYNLRAHTATLNSLQLGNIENVEGAINSNTADLNNKQDKLTAQTAYTAQGSATAIPSITTNSLGQVTEITVNPISIPSVPDNILTEDDVINNLTSDSITQPLSAAQGKALKAAIDSISGDIGELGGGDMMKATYDSNNNGIVDNAEKLGGYSASDFILNSQGLDAGNASGLVSETRTRTGSTTANVIGYIWSDNTYRYDFTGQVAVPIGSQVNSATAASSGTVATSNYTYNEETGIVEISGAVLTSAATVVLNVSYTTTSATSNIEMRQRRDTATNWTSINPVLAAGEIGVETDTNKIKVGNGSSTWSNLDYVSGNIVVDTSLSASSVNPIANMTVYTALNQKQDKLTIDSALSSTSTNPVQNKVITSQLNWLSDSINSTDSDVAVLNSRITALEDQQDIIDGGYSNHGSDLQTQTGTTNANTTGLSGMYEFEVTATIAPNSTIESVDFNSAVVESTYNHNTSSGVVTATGYANASGAFIQMTVSYYLPSSTIQQRRDTAANWTSANPVLAAGEIGIETNTNKMKVGNGSTAWNSLSYISGNTTVDTVLSASSANPIANMTVYTALSNKQDKLEFDTTPTSGSTNSVTSGSVFEAIQSAIGDINAILDQINGEEV